MEKFEKGTIIEINVPNVKKPIKAVVLDCTEYDIYDAERGIVLICYAQKRLFKVSCRYYHKIKLDKDGNPYKDEKYFNFKYEGIIIDYCDIPGIPDNL